MKWKEAQIWAFISVAPRHLSNGNLSEKGRTAQCRSLYFLAMIPPFRKTSKIDASLKIGKLLDKRQNYGERLDTTALHLFSTTYSPRADLLLADVTFRQTVTTRLDSLPTVLHSAHLIDASLQFLASAYSETLPIFVALGRIR